MDSKDVRRLKLLLERESRSPENIQKQIESSDSLVSPSEIETWKGYATLLLNADSTKANRLGLAMDVMKELNRGKTIDEIIQSLSQDTVSSQTDKSFALKHGIQFCKAFDGQQQEKWQETMSRLLSVEEFAKANHLNFDISQTELIPPEETFKQFLDQERTQAVFQSSEEIDQYRQELAKYIYNRLNENHYLYIGQIDLSNSTIMQSHNPVDIRNIKAGAFIHIQNAQDMSLAGYDTHQRDYLCQVQQVTFSEQTGLVLDTGSEILITMSGLDKELDAINPDWRYIGSREPTSGFESIRPTQPNIDGPEDPTQHGPQENEEHGFSQAD